MDVLIGFLIGAFISGVICYDIAVRRMKKKLENAGINTTLLDFATRK